MKYMYFQASHRIFLYIRLLTPLLAHCSFTSMFGGLKLDLDISYTNDKYFCNSICHLWAFPNYRLGDPIWDEIIIRSNGTEKIRKICLGTYGI